MISIDSHQFILISSSFSFDLAGVTLSSHFFFKKIYFNFICDDFFILYIPGIPEAVFDMEENEDRIYNLNFNYSFFLQIHHSNK